MSYLHHLIERAQGRAPVLQRRQPALFEPATPWAGGVARPAEEAAEPTLGAASAASPPAPASRAEAARRAPSRAEQAAVPPVVAVRAVAAAEPVSQRV
ncbi:MAG TPA: hypothetical protein VLA16_01950, partial [Ideonella sp.]|nr:hypothetical protein [Ideonella sp.]